MRIPLIFAALAQAGLQPALPQRRIGMEVCVQGFPEKTGKPIFGSDAFALKANGQVLKTPPGMWMCPMGKTQSELAFGAKLSCSNRDIR